MRWIGGANSRSLPSEQYQAAQLSQIGHDSHARLSYGKHKDVNQMESRYMSRRVDAMYWRAALSWKPL